MSSHKRTVSMLSVACVWAFNSTQVEASPDAAQQPASGITVPSTLVAEASVAPESPEVATVYKEVEALMLDAYPKAKITISGTKLHCEYKCHTEAGFYFGNGNGLVPQEGGILCNMSLQDGAYDKADKDRLPSEVQDGFHTVLTMAPYSQKINKHLFAQLLYPPDVSFDFKDRFKTLVNGFNKQELAEQAAQAKASADAITAKAAADAAARKVATTQAASSAPVTAVKPKLTGDVVGYSIIVYISDSDNQQGVEIGRFTAGGQVPVCHFGISLEPGKKHYLHIVSQPPNDRAIAGCFGLEYGATFALSNSTALDTRPAYWSVSNKGWGIECHRSGIYPKFQIDQIPYLKSKYPSLQAIMDPYAPADSNGPVYFSTIINPPK